MGDISVEREAAVRSLIAWMSEAPSSKRLAAIASHCNWQIPEVDQLIGWIIRQPQCSTEIVLNLLDHSGFWNDTQTLSADDPEFYKLCAEMFEGLRISRYQWAEAPKMASRPFPFEIGIAEWGRVAEVDLIPLYSSISAFAEQLPEEIKDVLEILGVGFGERTAKIARQMLIDKGYEPDGL